MDLGIAGRRAAISAASKGLGFATAEALAREGVRVALCSRDRGRAEEAAARLDGDAVALVPDVSAPAGARRFAHEAREALGGIDILVANNGGPPMGMAHETDFATLQASVNRCLFSMVALCQEVLPGMREQGWGRIVAITSIGVRQPLGNMVYSNTSRAGFTGFLKTLAREVVKDGVTVNSVLPSSIMTERIRQLVGEEGIPRMVAAVPAGRAGSAADFGCVAASFCAEWANYVTGVALPVDGGSDASLI